MERDVEVLVHCKLNVSQQCALVAKRPTILRILWFIRHSIASWLREVIVLLYSVLVQPHCVYSFQVWVPQYKKDVKLKGDPKEGYIDGEGSKVQDV